MLTKTEILNLVPNILQWELTECDINKDVKVSDGFHFAGPNIQVKYMDHLFSLYIKSMGKDTVYRIEERKHPHKPAILRMMFLIQ